MSLMKHHFEEAAELLEKNTWVKNMFGDGYTYYCTYGALAAVIGQPITASLTPPLDCHRSDINESEAAHSFARALGYSAEPESVAGVICAWNNEQRSKEDVVATLRAFARS